MTCLSGGNAITEAKNDDTEKLNFELVSGEYSGFSNDDSDNNSKHDTADVVTIPHMMKTAQTPIHIATESFTM